MIAIGNVRSLARVTAFAAGFIFSISACGDSSGPGELDSIAALQSLALGMGGLGVAPGAVPVNSMYDVLGPILDQVEVTIDGKSHTMFGLGLRESFPAGTCAENVFIYPAFPPEPGVCSPMPSGVVLLLWQSHSAFVPPDRMIFITADVGTTSFEFDDFFEYDPNLPTPIELFPAVAMYVAGEDDLWMSRAGTLTSQVSATSESCAISLPPYAKSASCNIAAFDEQGTITFEPFVSTSPIPSTRRLNVTIPRQTINGLWQAITETQPYTLPFPAASRRIGR